MKFDEKEYGKVIANNLRDVMLEHDKTQAEVAKALNISKATLSSWMNGTRIPRIKNIDRLCEYFNIQRSDIMQDKNMIETVASQRKFEEEQIEFVKMFTGHNLFTVLTPKEAEIFGKIKRLNKMGMDRLEEQLDFLLSKENYTLSEHELKERDSIG